jgi:hypothetical protein
MLRHTLASAESVYGEAHHKVAIHLNNLAGLLLRTNRAVDAEPLMRRALAIDEASYGEEHELVATGLNNLSAIMKASTRYDEAEEFVRRLCIVVSVNPTSTAR